MGTPQLWSDRPPPTLRRSKLWRSLVGVGQGNSARRMAWEATAKKWATRTPGLGTRPDSSPTGPAVQGPPMLMYSMHAARRRARVPAGQHQQQQHTVVAGGKRECHAVDSGGTRPLKLCVIMMMRRAAG